MIIPLTKTDIAVLLRAIRDKELDTDKIEALKDLGSVTIEIHEVSANK